MPLIMVIGENTYFLQTVFITKVFGFCLSVKLSFIFNDLFNYESDEASFHIFKSHLDVFSINCPFIYLPISYCLTVFLNIDFKAHSPY